MNEDFYPKPISELIREHFLVDKYQRGYKWTSDQVLELLSDINGFERTGSNFYCLQPVVVKARQDDTRLDLIDGQQRMTTIYILLRCLNEACFRIDYETRPGSADFLQNILSLPQARLEGTAVAGQAEQLETQLKQHWQAYIQQPQHESFDNVDNYHFFAAYQVIRHWLQQVASTDGLLMRLLFYTKVIWYKVDQNESAETVFRNINSGKIRLSSADLIKGLFVLDLKKHHTGEVLELRINEFAQEWGQIEYELQDDAFWFFLTEETRTLDGSSRIDLLFNLISGKPAKQTDPYYAYHWYTRQPALDWQQVAGTFQTLREWYADPQLFHYIGYLIAVKFDTLDGLLRRAKGQPKSVFRASLKSRVKDKFNEIAKDDTYPYHIDNLRYAQKPLNDTLLLFNIVTFMKSERSLRFPFHHFKEQKWSVEHIHAQRSKAFSKTEELRAWCGEIAGVLDKIDGPESQQLAAAVRALDDGSIAEQLPKAKKEQFSLLETRVFQFFGQFGELEQDKHKVSNLALLDRNTNSALNNGVYAVKRQKLLEIDRTGKALVQGVLRPVYVPSATRNAFLKYYSTDISQMYFWGPKDRQDYKAAIVRELGYFLPPRTKNTNP